MPEFELPGAEGDSGDKDRSKLNMTIAVTVALLTTFMAVAKIKDDNIVQAMQVAQAAAADTWNQYQAKRMRQAIAENATQQTELMRELVPADSRPRVDKLLTTQKQDAARYDKDKSDLAQKAKGFQADYDALGERDDQFDLADAMMTMSLALLAMTALTQKRFLLYVGWLLMAGGFYIGIAGFVGWRVHPDAIIKLLT